MTAPTHPVSDTPKTDAAQLVAIYEGHGGLFVEAAFARDQERTIAHLLEALKVYCMNGHPYWCRTRAHSMGKCNCGVEAIDRAEKL